MRRWRKVAGRVEENGKNAIKVPVSSRHYDMKWVAEEIFGNGDMEGGDMPASKPKGAGPDSVTFPKEGKKERCIFAGDWCDGMVTSRSLASARVLEGLGVHNGENIEYPHNMTRAVRPQTFADE